ncbi:MAG: serine/threonine protein kinase [Verrucomicrobiae bacterium]|nr:serine/threonine protein kinase [Verrucomicrobiae bacterium]
MSTRKKSSFSMNRIGGLIRTAENEALVAAGEVDTVLKGCRGAYSLEAIIGEGGMGATVYLAQTDHRKRVALKLLPPIFAADPGVAKRFYREAEFMRKISHHNIVRLLDTSNSATGRHFIVMEYVPGGSLAQRLAKGARLSVEESAQVVMEVCSGLVKMHRNGVIHRDLKPSNILIDEHGRPKLCDFGLAKYLRSSQASSPLTSTGEILGTYGFMAPEQLAASPEVDRRADIYSLGAVLYYLLTGNVPSGNVSPPSTMCRSAQPYDSIVMRALETEPARRFQSATEMRQALSCVSGNGRTISRRKIVAGGVATLAIAASGAIWFAPGTSRKFWSDVASAQSLLTTPGGHDVVLELPNGRTIHFAIALSDDSVTYQLTPADLPQHFMNPIALASLRSVATNGFPGMVARLALQSFTIDLPGPINGNTQLQLANLPVLDGHRSRYVRFLRGCDVVDRLSNQSLLIPHGGSSPMLNLDPVACPDFASFSELLGYDSDSVSQVTSDEGRAESLLRVATYELLRHEDGEPHPSVIGGPGFDITEMEARSLLEVLGALIAEKWLFQKMQAADWLGSKTQSIYDADLGRANPENQVAAQIVEQLLALKS